MKKLKLLLFLFLAASLGSGCRKLSTPEPAEGNPVSNQMIAIVDGQPWAALSLSAVRTAESMTITGSSTDGKTITLYLEAPLSGQKHIGPGAKNFGSFVDDTAKTSYRSNLPGGDGYATFTGIDEVSKTVSGRFHFIGISNTGDTINVAEGKFIRIPYSTPGTGGDEKVISAKIDGLEWGADNVFALVSSGKLTITGYRNDNTAIGLTMPAGITTGNYEISAAGDYTAQYNKNLVDVLGATTGALIITEHNPGTRTIKGDFSFEAEVQGNPDNAATITNGVFEVVYD